MADFPLRQGQRRVDGGGAGAGTLVDLGAAEKQLLPRYEGLLHLPGLSPVTEGTPLSNDAAAARPGRRRHRCVRGQSYRVSTGRSPRT